MSTEAEPKVVEEQQSVDDDMPPLEEVEGGSDDDLPALETVTAEEEEAEAASSGATSSGHRQTKQEKKSRKALMKLGLKAVPDVSRVTVKRPKQGLLVFTRPDVFKSPSSNTYVIFGEAKMEDPGMNRFGDAAKAFGDAEDFDIPGLDDDDGPPALEDADDDGPPALEDADDAADDAADGAAASADGLEETDINLVVSQTGASREDAIKALTKHNSDIVNAIMSLSAVST
jgi:nascent polypeptide-associated complex subunit alpha